MKEKKKAGSLDNLKSLTALHVFDNIGESISIQDTDFRIIYMNSAAVDIIGNHVGEHCYKAFEGRESVCPDCPLEKTFKDGGTYKAERKNPITLKTLFVEIVSSPIKDSDGNIIAGMESARDITERRIAESNLAESEARYRDLIENAYDMIQSVAPDGKFLFVNDAWLNVMGYEKEDIKNISMFDILHPDSLEHCTALFGRVMSGEAQRNVEAAFVTKNGKRIDVEGNIKCRVMEGKPVATHGIFREITERKKAEQTLLFNEERYRSLVESTEDSIYLVNRGHEYIFMNRHHMSRLGISNANYTGKKYRDYHSEEDTVQFNRVIDSVFETGESARQEYKNAKGDKFFLRTLSPVKDKKGQVVAVTVISKDITDRKQFEYKLQVNEERYRSLVESTEDSIYLVDKNYRYVFMNKQHMSRIGLSEDDYKQHSYLELHSLEESSEFVKLVDKVFDTGLSVQQDHKSQRDGKYFLRTLSPVKDKNGKVVAVTILSKNITDRKKMEQDLHTLAITDELTGLYNRRGFLTLAGQQLKLANRLKRGVLIFYADLDHLKTINDKYGHEEGDMAIMESANILRDVFRESDIIARIGGDEFVVFPVQVDDTSAEKISKRFKEHLDTYNAKGRREYPLSLSAGIAYYPRYHQSIEALLVQADKQMYEQKKERRKG